MNSTAGEVRRLGVMGGTFDPVHIGHLVAASEALHAFALDRVLFVPAGRPWQKAALTDAEDRYLMTVLGVADHPRFAVSRVEIDRSGPTYSVDTLEDLRGFYGDDVRLMFIAGVDTVAQLHTWHRIERVAEVADVICVTRPGFRPAAPESAAVLPRIHVLTMPGIDVSSTDIRERVREGRPIEYLVPRRVADFVRDRGLYAGEDRVDV